MTDSKDVSGSEGTYIIGYNAVTSLDDVYKKKKRRRWFRRTTTMGQGRRQRTQRRVLDINVRRGQNKGWAVCYPSLV